MTLEQLLAILVGANLISLDDAKKLKELKYFPLPDDFETMVKQVTNILK